MLVEAIISLVLFFVLYLSVKCWILPKKEYNRYLSTLKRLGYKVHAIPFKPFRVPFVQLEQESLKKYNDSCYITKRIAASCDVILTNASNSIFLIITSPLLMKDYFSTENVDSMAKTKMITFGLSTFAGKGLFLSEGNEWRAKRKILSKVFNFQLLKTNISEIAKIADQTFDYYESGRSEIDEQAITVFSNFTNRVVLKCFFGEKDFKEEVNGVPFSNVIIEMIEDSVKIAFTPAVLIFGQKALKWGLTKQIRKFSETISIFNSICKDIVQRKTEEIQSKLLKSSSQPNVCCDLLEALIIQKKKCLAEGQQFVYNDEDIVQQFATFVAAGTDTTSSLIALMLYYICSNPHIQSKLRAEIEENIKNDEDYTFEKLKLMTYLDCIQKETSRFYGPATILVPKKIQQDVYFSDLFISKGTLLTINLFGCHYRQEFFDNPYQFKPERWEKEAQSMSPYSFIAFGGGPRGCIGKQLANLESKIIITKLFKRYRQIVVPKQIKLIDGFVYFAQKLKIKLIK